MVQFNNTKNVFLALKKMLMVLIDFIVKKISGDRKLFGYQYLLLHSAEDRRKKLGTTCE